MSLRRIQEMSWSWANRVLGPAVVRDRTERAIRLVEEVIEFAQALDVGADRIHALVDYVYSRPKGDPTQEIGGVVVTLCCAASAIDVEVGVAAEAEVRRIHEPDVIARVQRRQHEKRALGHAEPVTSAPEPAPDTNGSRHLYVLPSGS